MSSTKQFSYESLFSDGLPAGRSRQAGVRAKYDFAVAYPDPETIPGDELVESLAAAMREEAGSLALYPNAQGYPPLREYVSEKLASDRGIAAHPDNVYLGEGSSQVIYLLCRALLNPGDIVLADEFFYSGTLNMFRGMGAEVRGVPCDDDGMSADALDEAIVVAVDEGRRPKFIYLIPTFQNPQGWTMSLERRKAILEVTGRHGIVVFEDDCYVDLRFEGENVHSIRSLDDSGRVLYVGSFSKIIAPGVRMGYMVAPDEMLDRIPPIKAGGGINEMAAMTIHRFAKSTLSNHLDHMLDVQRTKRDAMLAALGESFGSSATWNRPEGGLYLWLKMPGGTDIEDCREAAAEAGVLYQSGVIFSPTGEGRNYARLCFGYNSTSEIHEGIAKMADVFDAQGVL